MAEYKLFNNLEGKTGGVMRKMGTVGTSRNELYIPFEPANTDYQEYLAWVDAGNTPEAAD